MNQEQRNAFVMKWILRFGRAALVVMIVFFAIALHLSINSGNVQQIATAFSGLILHLIFAVSLIDYPANASDAKPVEKHMHKHLHFHVSPHNYPRGHYIYVIRDKDVTGHYKIGRTNSPYIRLSTFEVKLPFEIEIIAIFACQNATIMESELHQRYAHKRVRGEWFALDESDIAELKQMTIERTPND